MVLIDNLNKHLKYPAIDRIRPSYKSFLLLVVCTFLINFVGEGIAACLDIT